MKKSAIVAVGVGVLLASAMTVLAGSKYTGTVYVTSTHADGTMGDARNSADSVQDIGCYVETTGSGYTTYCGATNASGTYGGCSTTNTYMANVAMGLSPGVNVGFSWSGATCTLIGVSNFSYWRPMTP